MSRYQTEDELNKIIKWPHIDFKGLMDFVKSIWEYADCGYWTKKGRTYYISTGGWSGNEDIIYALQKNKLFWVMCWQQSRRGGHYILHVK